MAIQPTLAELEAELAAVRAKRTEILLAPLQHSTGRTSYDNTQNVKALDREETRLKGEIAAFKRRIGQIGPGRRELW